MLLQHRFKDRVRAGRVLGEELRNRGYADRSDSIVLALPRGGVPVAFEVARRLHAPLDVFIVRKLGVPGHEELAMGAIATGGVRVINEEVVRMLGVPDEIIDEVARLEQAELERRQRDYRGGRAAPNVRGRTVIVIDDGLATGSTMRAAVAALREQGPSGIVVAVPVAAEETCAELRGEADEVICAMTPRQFQAVGLWYKDFSPTTDEEVRELLQRAWRREADDAIG